jgi:thioredoxin-like negative regulator of GroEL
MQPEFPNKPLLKKTLRAAWQAEEAADWAAAVKHWKTLLEAWSHDPRASKWSKSLALAQERAGLPEDADATLRTLMLRDANSSAAFEGLARLATMRKEWKTLAAISDDYIRRFPHSDEVAKWRATRARALEKQEAWLEAADVWKSMLEFDENDEDALLGRARNLLKRGEMAEEAEQAVNAALQKLPDSSDALKLHAQIARLQGDQQLTLQRLRDHLALDPEDIDLRGRAVETALRAGDWKSAKTVLEDAPPAQQRSVPFQARVALAYHMLRGDVVSGAEIVARIDWKDADVRDAVCAAEFLGFSGRHKEAAALLAQFSVRFSRNQHLARSYLAAVFHAHGPDTFAAEKTRLLQQLKPDDAVRLLARLNTSWRTSAETELVLDHALSADDSDRTKRQFRGLLASHDPQVLSYLSRRLETSGGGIDRITAKILHARTADLQRLAYANLGGNTWDDFATASRDLSATLMELTEKTPDALAPSFMACARSLRQAMQAAGDAWINSGESYYDAASFSVWLGDRIARGAPTSVVRLGDGEGNYLPYAPSLAEFQRPDQRNIQQTWWGRKLLDDTQADGFAARFSGVVGRADAIGVPPFARLMRSLSERIPHATPISRGLASIFRFLDVSGPAFLRDKPLLSCHIHSDLEQWDLYRQIFAHVDSVSVISCHDLSPFLARQFAVHVRAWHRIPAEKKYQSMFGIVEAGEESIYPDVFDRIESELAPLKGELVLVAAGFLGKFFCDTVRARGGIALDIGSVADLWMGFVTRAYGKSQRRFDVACSLIAGQPFEDNFGRSAVSGADPCESDETRRFDLTGSLSQYRGSEPVESAIFAVRVIGHPRCGSRYVSQVLTTLGLHIGHERMGQHGTCSWIHTIDDRNPPFNAPYVAPRLFRTTLAYIRSPADAIPSIMLENTNADSFAFRRLHIFRKLAVDIARWRDPVARSVDSYLCWMKIVEMQRPMFTLRVEHIRDDLRLHSGELEFAGIRLQLQLDASVPNTANSSLDKFSIAKPELAADQYRALVAELQDALGDMCARYDYQSLF